MYILAIETTGEFASVAILKDKNVQRHIEGEDRFSHLRNLMPQIEEVLKQERIALGDLSAIAVSQGPGSFTGIRIGVSSARGLSQATGVPCVAVNSLEGLALNCRELETDEDVLFCPMIDARRQQIYGGGYFLKNGMPEEVIKGGPYTVEEFIPMTEGYGRVVVLGDGAGKYRELIENLSRGNISWAPEELWAQQGASVGLIGSEIFALRGGVSFDCLEPNYMRIAEAERKLMEQRRLVEDKRKLTEQRKQD